MPAHVVYGDSFLVAGVVRQVIRDAGASDVMDSNHHRLSAAQAQPAEAVATCNSLPFLDAVRLVEIEGALATEESAGGRRGRGRGTRRQTGSGSGWMQLAEAVPEMPDTTLLVLVDGEVADSNPLLRALAERCQVHKQSAPSGQGLGQWIKRSAEERGGSITPPAIQAIMEMIGNDLWTLDRELEKLSLFATGREITEPDVRALVPYAQEANIFAAVDAIMDRRPGDALRLLAQLMEEGREPLYIIAMIERQLRLIALARDLTDRGVVQPELGRRMGANSDFVVRKTLGQARRMTLPEISLKYRRVLESDLAIKQGRLDPEVSLELLVADLAGAGAIAT